MLTSFFAFSGFSLFFTPSVCFDMTVIGSGSSGKEGGKNISRTIACSGPNCFLNAASNSLQISPCVVNDTSSTNDDAEMTGVDCNFWNGVFTICVEEMESGLDDKF